MAPHELRRPFKRAAVSDQQRRREIALQRQAQQRADSQNHARRLASSVLALDSEPQPECEPEPEPVQEMEIGSEAVATQPRDLDAVQASRMRGREARLWFARQLMLPEWMIDVPPHLDRDWYVFARPSGKRCFVVSSNGTTVSRLRNGSVLHRFPSAFPHGARTKDLSGPAHSYCLLDCIFHEPDQTYYVIDMVCWRDYSLYDCSAEFRFFWLNSKLAETGASNPPSVYHKYRFCAVPIYNCDRDGLHAAYMGDVPYTKDGLLFYNKHAHYQTGNTPLVLVWKDENCSQYVLDTDREGQVPSQQQVVLELQDDGKITTSDDPPFVFACLNREFLEKSGLRSGNLLRFAIKHESVRFVDGKLDVGELQYIGKANRARAFADSFSKVLFQYIARNSPLQIEDLAASIQLTLADDSKTRDVDMVG